MLSSTVALSVVALGVLSTGIAYVLNYRLIQDEGPTAASMTNYLAPVVAVVLGVAFVDERLSWNLVVGTALVLLGVWIAEHNPEAREPRPVTPWCRQRTAKPRYGNASDSTLEGHGHWCGLLVAMGVSSGIWPKSRMDTTGVQTAAAGWLPGRDPAAR
jgi:hypothetical protein